MNGNTSETFNTPSGRGIAIACSIILLAAALLGREAIAAFPYSSGSGGEGKVCQNATYISCTTDADCAAAGVYGSCVDNTGYSYPWYMNGYSTLIFDFGQPVDDLPPPILTYDDGQQRVCLSGKVIGFRSDNPSVQVVYDIRSNDNPDDLFTDPNTMTGPLGMCYYGVEKIDVEGDGTGTAAPGTLDPLCTDGSLETCTQNRYAYTLNLNDVTDPSTALNGVLVFNQNDSVALGRGYGVLDNCDSNYVPGTSTGLPCRIQIGFDDNYEVTDNGSTSCIFPSATTPFGFDVAECEVFRFEEKCVQANVSPPDDDPLSLEGTVFESRGDFEGCDGLGLVTRMCNDAGTASPSCAGQQQGYIVAQTGDELSIEDRPLLVCVGPTIEDLLAKLQPYDGTDTPIVIYPCADNTEGKIEAPTVFTSSTLVFGPSEGDTTLSLNIVGVGVPFASTELFQEVANKNEAVWDFSEMAMFVNVIDGLELDDDIKGSEGPDLILGGNGNDLLDGYLGNDTLWGQQNDDTSFGGQGDDCFVLDSKLGKDTIGDFGNGNDVLVNISGTAPTLEQFDTTCRVSLKGQNYVDVLNTYCSNVAIYSSFDGLSCPAAPY